MDIYIYNDEMLFCYYIYKFIFVVLHVNKEPLTIYKYKKNKKQKKTIEEAIERVQPPGSIYIC